MGTLKLTKRLLDDALPRDRDFILWDSEVRGLGLKVTPAGKKSFVLFYRTADHTQRKPTLGRYGSDLTLDQARGIARDMLAAVRGGSDPSAARQEARQAPTVSDACDRFLKEHAARKKTLTEAQYKTIVTNRIKPALGSRKVASITHDDVVGLVHGIGKTHKFAANRTRAVLSKMFALCEKWGMRPTGSNPVVHVEKYAERTRHRDLTDPELAKLAQVLIEAEAPVEPGKDRRVTGVATEDVSEDPRAVAAIRLLLFSGMRKNEVLRLKWPELDLARGLARLGDSKTGQKVVILNAAAVEVLKAQEKVKVPGSDYVFPGRKKGRPLSDIGGPWERIRKRAGLDDGEAMRVHDLRHNFGSAAAAQELSLPTIGKLLGHKRSTTTERYAALADHPARRASEKVGQALVDGMKAGVSE